MAENTSEFDALSSALLQSSVGTAPIIVKAEDIKNEGSGIDYSKHFFEPQVGSTYLIKFLPNPKGLHVETRYVYKDLPDPDRKGKTFQYVSSGNAKTCKALELFFELNDAKKNGDAVADAKIKKYLGKTNQSCCKIQILQSPKQEEIGMVRLLNFANFGANATIANLVNVKLNPTKEQLEQGYEVEDIFDIFESSVMSVVCVEGVYEGGDFSKSSWAPKKRGAIAKLSTGETREFKATDKVNNQVIAEALPYFTEFAKTIFHDDFDVKKWFSFKSPEDEGLDKDTKDYITKVFQKVDEIIPVIREKSMQEIAVYGKHDSSSSSNQQKPDNAKNVMADSIPTELQNSVAAGDNKASTQSPSTDNEVEDIINNS